MSNFVVPIDGDHAVEDDSYRKHAREGSLMTQVLVEMKIGSRLVSWASSCETPQSADMNLNSTSIF